MKTAFCGSCGAGISVVMSGEEKKEWKQCPSCKELCYLELSNEQANVVTLQKIIDDTFEKPNGEQLFKYLLKKEEGSDMQDLLFNSSKALEQNIIYMTEIGLLVKQGNNYVLHPDLKKFVAQKFK